MALGKNQLAGLTEESKMQGGKALGKAPFLVLGSGEPMANRRSTAG
jgi:hypothetical protein